MFTCKVYLFVGVQGCKEASHYPAVEEYVAMSEAVKEIRFIYFILCDVGIEVELPIVVKTDNVGAMFMTQNSKSHF